MKKRIFGSKFIFLGQQSSVLDSKHVLSMTGQGWAKEKAPFPPINISLLALLVFFLAKIGFLGCFSLFGKTNRLFLRYSGRDQLRCNVGNFFGDLDGSKKVF